MLLFKGSDERFALDRNIPSQTRFRSVPDVTDTKFAVSLLAKLLIKCRRLPRVCLDIFSIKCCFLGSSAENKHTSNKNIFMIDFYFLRLNYSFLNSQQTSIDKKGFPKEAPWKTLVLNEQLC